MTPLQRELLRRSGMHSEQLSGKESLANHAAVTKEPSQHPATNVSPNSNLRRGSPPSEHRAEKGPLEKEEEVILSPLVQRWARINGGGEREEVETKNKLYIHIYINKKLTKIKNICIYKTRHRN